MEVRLGDVVSNLSATVGDVEEQLESDQRGGR